ncbi:TIF1G [Mytilus edulis]|uniref:TRIM33 n=1 Tax=Mytilus edulis TaxID=6550 RepID=A0A8S3S2U0_MYTED|nr:TIF1G [Mytilus edulis]
MAAVMNQCEICFKDGILSTAVMYCVNCKHPLCKTCLTNHSKFRAIKGHKMLPVDEISKIPDFVRNYDEFCIDHSDEKREYLCKEHKTCICFECLKDQHKTCTSVCKITEVTLETELHSEIETFRKQVSIIDELAGKLIDSFSEDVVVLQKKILSAQDELRNLISKLQSSLHRCETQFKAKVSTMCEQIKLDMKKCKIIRESTVKRSQELNEFVKYGDNFKIFIKLEELKSENIEDEKLLHEINNKTHRTEVSFTISQPDFENLFSCSFRSY